jgi:dTDP-4-dehydrorhamnose 3,5-epimerase
MVLLVFYLQNDIFRTDRIPHTQGEIMHITELSIAGCFLIVPALRTDDRGHLEKTFDGKLFSEYGMNINIQESFHTISKKGVVRGMHFQLPPHDCAKYVSVSRGKICDIILDLRTESSTYGNHIEVEISSANRNIIHIPSGCAHGFLSLEDETCTRYLQTAGFSPSCDSGISFDSFGYKWPTPNPILSEKDRNLPALASFNSPF